MFTSLDKAIVALVMGAIFLINNFTSFHFAVDESVVNAIAGVITPILVYLTPNKAKA